MSLIRMLKQMIRVLRENHPGKRFDAVVGNEFGIPLGRHWTQTNGTLT